MLSERTQATGLEGESLLGSFMDSEVLIKTQFFAYNESKIFEAVHLFQHLAVDGGGFSLVWGVCDVLMTSYFVLSTFTQWCSVNNLQLK